jgi:GNAT superfamily N-acetyltransferase
VIPGVVVRPYQRSDQDFVLDATCNVRYPRGLPWTDWRYAYGALVSYWLDNGRCVVADAGDDTALGFAVGDTLVRMVYVKREFRGHGLGAELLGALGVWTPHDPNRAWQSWVKRRGP